MLWRVSRVYTRSLTRHGRPMAYMSVVKAVAGVLRFAITRTVLHRIMPRTGPLPLTPRPRILVRARVARPFRLVAVDTRPLRGYIRPYKARYRNAVDRSSEEESTKSTKATKATKASVVFRMKSDKRAPPNYVWGESWS